MEPGGQGAWRANPPAAEEQAIPPGRPDSQSFEFLEERGIIGDRLLAKVIDQLLILVIEVVVAIPLWIGGIIALALNADSAQTESGDTPAGFIYGVFGLWAAVLVMTQLIVFGYYFLMERGSRQTIGKKAFDLRALDESGGRMSGKQALARAALNTVIQWSPLWTLEILVMAVNEDGRRLTDIITRTKVAKTVRVYQHPPEGSA